MKDKIHPEYGEAIFVCACGARFKTRSTKIGTFNVEICSKCHPFYTNTQRTVMSGGRVERFEQRLKATKAVNKKIKSKN